MAEAPPPFWAEGPIPPALLDVHFVGRTEDRVRLARRWGQRAPARTVLSAPALGGKRSLLAASLADAEVPVVPIRVACHRLLPETPRGLVEAMLAGLRGKAPEAGLARAARTLQYGPPEAPDELILGLDALLDPIPGGRPILVLEGAHALARLPEPTLGALDAWAAASRAHTVALVDHLPQDLQAACPAVFGPRGVRVTRPAPLGRPEAEAFLRDRFAAARCQPTPEALAMLLEYAGGDPASLQLLGARCHDVLQRRRKGRLEEGDVVDGLFLTLESLPPEWTRVLGALSGRARDAFVALAVLDGPSVADVGRRIHLDGKNVSVLLARLAERGAPIEKTGRGRWRITHRLLKEWVRKEWTVVR